MVLRVGVEPREETAQVYPGPYVLRAESRGSQGLKRRQFQQEVSVPWCSSYIHRKGVCDEFHKVDTHLCHHYSLKK